MFFKTFHLNEIRKRHNWDMKMASSNFFKTFGDKMRYQGVSNSQAKLSMEAHLSEPLEFYGHLTQLFLILISPYFLLKLGNAAQRGVKRFNFIPVDATDGAAMTSRTESGWIGGSGGGEGWEGEEKEKLFCVYNNYTVSNFKCAL